MSSHKKPRLLLVVRHGERIDFTFNASNESWLLKAFDDHGKYQRFNINMPRCLPHRKDGFNCYATDSPLTEIGYLQAKIVGRALKDAGIKPSAIYVSPAYRCIQTCVGILKGMHNTTSHLNIEPGLFEWAGWYKPQLPSWMTPQEFVQQGYPVNQDYSPLYKAVDLDPTESIRDYYNRSHAVAEHALDKHKDEGGVILLVGHGASLDTCTRELVGGHERTLQEFYAVLHQTPYLALCAAREEGSATGGGAAAKWSLCDPPILPLQHQANGSYDWKVLKDPKI